jgi:hypothetical protein
VGPSTGAWCQGGGAADQGAAAIVAVGDAVCEFDDCALVCHCPFEFNQHGAASAAEQAGVIDFQEATVMYHDGHRLMVSQGPQAVRATSGCELYVVAEVSQSPARRRGHHHALVDAYAGDGLIDGRAQRLLGAVHQHGGALLVAEVSCLPRVGQKLIGRSGELGGAGAYEPPFWGVSKPVKLSPHSFERLLLGLTE